jgi:starch synthase (maltosyl-transferring)
MTAGENDRWSGVAHFVNNAEYELTIEAWGDEFGSWRAEYEKKFNAGITELPTEIAEGAILLEKTASRADRKADKERLMAFAVDLRKADAAEGFRIARDIELMGLMGA